MSGWRALWPVVALFAARGGWRLVAGFVLALATVLAGVGLLGLSGWFIAATAFAGLSAATALVFDVFAPAAAIRLLALTRTAGRYGERLATHDATLRVLAALRERLFRGWAEPGAARRLLARPARLLFRLTLDTDALDALYLRVLLPAGTALGAALAAGLVVGAPAGLLGLALALSLVAAGVAAGLFAAQAARRPQRRRAHALEALRARVIDLVAGQTDLAMAGRLGAQREAVVAADRRLVQAEDALDRIEAGAGAAFSLAAAAVLAGALVAAAALVEAQAISVPVGVMILLVAFACAEPFAALPRGALALGRTLVAARRLAPRLRPQEPPPRPALPPPDYALRVTAATAAYPEATTPALREVSLCLRPGERVALVGRSGAGKSTLLALVAGELAPARGAVESVPATLFTQRTEIFRDDLRGNLRLARPDAGDAQLWQALEAAGLAADLRRLPRGLDTPLGEGALGLSGGQARRLALARVLLRATPLWLLDEPTEGLDAATAGDVLTRLCADPALPAMLIATHIRREAESAGRILVMDAGRIVADHARGEAAFAAALARLRPD